MDSIRRNILTTGVAATAMAAAPRVFAQQTGQGEAMPFYEKGPVRIHYEEAGSGFPLLLIAGGGLNSTIAGLAARRPFDPIAEFKGEYRCIAADLRNANRRPIHRPARSRPPLGFLHRRPIGLMDHLGIDKFMVMGFCIGGPVDLEPAEARARSRRRRRAGAAERLPPGAPTLFYDSNIKGWGPELIKRRPEITMETVEKFLTKMYRTNPDFVFTRDARFRAQLPDAGADPAGRYSGASLRGRDGSRDARAEGGGEHVPVEGAEGADSAGGAPDPLVPARTPTGAGIGNGVETRRVLGSLITDETADC